MSEATGRDGAREIEPEDELLITERWGELGFALDGIDRVKIDYRPRLSSLFLGLFALGLTIALIGGVVVYTTEAEVELWIFVATGVCSIPFALLSLDRGEHHLFDAERGEVVLHRPLFGRDFSSRVVSVSEIAGLAADTTSKRDSDEGVVYFSHRPALITRRGRVLLLGKPQPNLPLLNRSLEELAALLRVEVWPAPPERKLRAVRDANTGEVRAEYLELGSRHPLVSAAVAVLVPLSIFAAFYFLVLR